jgi:hypothetical protein
MHTVRMTTAPLDRADLLRDLAAGDTQCTARSKRTGKRCRLASMLGGNVCRAHGGAAPQTRAKAKRRLEQAADVLVQRLLGFALDGDVPEATALAAIRDALDRAGLNPKTAVELEVKPWQDILGNVAGVARISQDESRVRRGLPVEHDPTPALPPADDSEPIDAEVVEPPAKPPWAEDMPQRPSPELATLEDAAAWQAQERARITGTRRIRSRRG